MGERVTVEIPMAPGKNVLGLDRWWRNRHNDTTVWKDRVAGGMLDAGAIAHVVRHVHVDWGRRRPSMKDRAERITRAVSLVCVVDDDAAVTEEWSGVGRGTTWLELEKVG